MATTTSQALNGLTAKELYSLFGNTGRMTKVSRRNFVNVRISTAGIFVVRFSRNSLSSSRSMLSTAMVVAIHN